MTISVHAQIAAINAEILALGMKPDTKEVRDEVSRLYGERRRLEYSIGRF